MRYSLHCIIVLMLYISWTLARKVPSPPYIVKQPPTDDILFQVEYNEENDKPFYIECEAIGEPFPKYHWLKNGRPLDFQIYDDRISQQPGKGTLVVTRPSDIDQGQYQCFAENQYGIAISNSVFVRKGEINSFKKTELLTLTGNEGEPFKLQCTSPNGWPKPVVHWVYFFTNGSLKTIMSSRVTTDPEGNLWFSNLTKFDKTDNFMYACAATSPTTFKYKLGNRVLLNVISSGVSASQNKHEPVLQYASRKNEVAYRGKRAELFCIFGGTPLPQTVWTKEGKLVKSSDRIRQGNYGKSLIIKVVDFDDEGFYTCEVSNGVGEVQSRSIHLKVMAVPYFIKEPELVNAAEDETIEFHCAAGGAPQPAIKWIHNGRPIEEAPYNPRRSVETNKITIKGLTTNDTGNYGCNATNFLGYVYKDVYVNVLALVAPEITEPPRNTQAVVNQNVTLTCKVLGAPRPNIKWIQNGSELTGGRYDVQINGDLTIDKVQFDDKGNYTCYAENRVGNTSASARLDIKFHTYITDGPEEYEVVAGTSAILRCNAVADNSLDLKIIWLKNDQPIDYEGEPRFEKSSNNSLTITKTHELDCGTYTCLAKTDLDEASAKAQLIVQDVPNPPGMRAVECRVKDAKISWMPFGDNRAPILNYIIQYNTSFIPEEWKDVSQVPPTDISYNVPLEAWVNYTFRVIAVNKIGRSKPSSHSERCSTPTDVPHKNPENVKGEGDSPDNLVITWTPMPQIEHGAPGFKYRVGWKRAIHGVKYDYVDIHDYKQDRYIVANQPSYQLYKIKVFAQNQMGNANVSPKEVIGYSGESEPEAAPTNFTVLEIQGPTTALLSWKPVPLESVRGHFKGYKIKIWSDTSLTAKEIIVQGATSWALVSNFDPYTKNYAQVYAFNGKYNGPPSNEISFETPKGDQNSSETPKNNRDKCKIWRLIVSVSPGFHLKWEKLCPQTQSMRFLLDYKIN